MADNDPNNLPADPSAFDLVAVDHQPTFVSDALIPKPGATPPPQNLANQVAGFPQRAADLTIDALGPLGEAGMTVGDMMRTGTFDPRMAVQAVGGTMLGVGMPPVMRAGEAAIPAVEAAAEDLAPAATQGIRAFHGSPYDFDQFDINKIGTGEGAQAYGHGLYFAENPQTAQSYRNSLSDLKPYQVEGTNYELPSWVAKGVASKNPIAIADMRSTFEGRIADMQRGIDSGEDIQPWVTQGNIDGLKQILTGLDRVSEGANLKAPGKTYEVNLAANPEHFLDWDKPLSQQSPYVQNALNKLPLPNGDVSAQSLVRNYLPDVRYAVKQPNGMFGPSQSTNFHDALREVGGDKDALRIIHDPSPEAATRQLRQAGIPGIKYLDQGSRNQTPWIARHPQGGISDFPNEQQARAFVAKNPEYSLEPPNQTSNYVVFDPSIINIVRKYGLAGLIGAGAAHFQTQPVDHNPFAGQGMADGGVPDDPNDATATAPDPWLALPRDPATGRPVLTITPAPTHDLVPVDHAPQFVDAPTKIDPVITPDLSQTYPPVLRNIGTAAANVGQNIATDILSLPKRVLESSEELRQTGEYNPEAPVEAATLLATGAFPAAEEGAAGIFGGKLAQTADLDKLRQAQDLQAQGTHPLNIWHQTGWFQGADGQWRFEIPDTNLTVSPGQGTGLGNEAYIQHPELAQAYPQLSTLQHDLGLVENQPRAGEYAPGATPRIAVTAPDSETLRQSTGHELQHAVGNIEGFTPGTSPMAMRPEAERLGPNAIPGSPMSMDQLAYNIYHRTAGEVEARNVSRRMDMSDTGRWITPPYRTEDVPRGEQVVLPNTQGPQAVQPRGGAPGMVRPLGIEDQLGTEKRIVPYGDSPIINEIRSHVDAADGYTRGGYPDFAAWHAAQARALAIQNGFEADPLKWAWPSRRGTYEAPHFESGEPVGQADVPEPNAPPFYSTLENAVTNAKTNAAPAQQWLGMLKNTPGVKPEEMNWLGVEDWLKGQKGPVSKQALADFIRGNRVDVREVMRGGTRGYGAPTLDEVAMEQYGTPYNELDGDVQRELRESINDTYGDQPLPAKFGRYTLPGGANYREMLLTLPNEKAEGLDARRREIEALGRSATPDQRQEWAAIMNRLRPDDRDIEGISRFRGMPDFRSSHWDEPNVLAHVRFDDRMIDGDKTLHIGEIQSDWAQKARREGFVQSVTPEERTRLEAERESLASSAVDAKQLIEDKYRRLFEASGIGNSSFDQEKRSQFWSRMQDEISNDPSYNQKMDRITEINKRLGSGGVPAAPFVSNTDVWSGLALKRMLRYASENGYQRLSWDTGATNAERYDLSKHIDTLHWEKVGDHIEVRAEKDGDMIFQRAAKPDNLDEMVGKDVAERIVKDAQAKPKGSLTGLDLRVGGEPMSAFYDQILPNVANKLIKKYGTRVEDAAVLAPVPGFPTFTANRTAPVHSIKITPALRKAAMTQGFPLFHRGGAVHRAKGGRVNPLNIDHHPSEAQKEAGNYAKDHLSWNGLPITIENAKGSVRRGTDKNGKPWAATLPAHYGYIKRTQGADMDHVDVYIGPHPKASLVFLVDQVNADSKKFDEHKAMLGFGSEREARLTYQRAFSDGRGKDRIGNITSMTLDQFKQWLANGNTKKPFAHVAARKDRVREILQRHGVA